MNKEIKKRNLRIFKNCVYVATGFIGAILTTTFEIHLFFVLLSLFVFATGAIRLLLD